MEKLKNKDVPLKIQEEFYANRCKTCAHWNVLANITHWGHCKEPELLKFLSSIILPDYFGCLWYQPKLSEKLKKFQIQLIK